MSGACFGFLPSTVVIHVILSGFPRKSPKQLPSKSLFSILRPGKGITLQEINISHLGKRKIIFKMPFLGDMLVPWRVCLSEPLIFVWGSSDGVRDRSTESLSTNNQNLEVEDLNSKVSFKDCENTPVNWKVSCKLSLNDL